MRSKFAVIIDPAFCVEWFNAKTWLFIEMLERTVVKSPLSLSRRDMLRMVGTGVVGAVAGSALSGLPTPTLAQDAAQVPKPIGFFQFQVGDISVTVIRDGVRPFDSAALGLNAPEGALAKLLKDNNLPTSFNNTFNVLLLKAGERMILVDTGLGVAAGSLVPTLGALSIQPDMITDVVFSHQHGDHIGGALTNGKLSFPKAMYHYPEAERMVVEKAAESAGITNNKNLLKAAGDADQLKTFKADAEVLPGIMAIAAYGHTLGHTAFMLSSANQSLLCTVDSALNNVVTMAHPEWHVQQDSDKAMAVETRKRLFGDAAAKGTRVVAYHFPFPGTGFIAKDGDGFRFIAAM
jgi:glyoxylase-like metal-dependent hydrolase (beta-lactamase superfamily II)